MKSEHSPHQSINQSINQGNEGCANYLINQSINQPREWMICELSNQSINWSIEKICHEFLTNQSINWLNNQLDDCRSFFEREINWTCNVVSFRWWVVSRSATAHGMWKKSPAWRWHCARTSPRWSSMRRPMSRTNCGSASTPVFIPPLYFFLWNFFFKFFRIFSFIFTMRWAGNERRIVFLLFRLLCGRRYRLKNAPLLPVSVRMLFLLKHYCKKSIKAKFGSVLASFFPFQLRGYGEHGQSYGKPRGGRQNSPQQHGVCTAEGATRVHHGAAGSREYQGQSIRLAFIDLFIQE